MKKPSILVVGSISGDMTACMEEYPRLGQTVPGTDYSFATGGKGANCAVAAARLGGDVTFAGRVGDDQYGKQAMAALEREGVRRMMKVDPRERTGFALILLDASGQNRIVVYQGANARIAPEDLEEVFAAREYDALVMPLEITEEALYAASSMAARRGIPVVIDAGPAVPVALERIAGIEIISPNETECEAFSGVFPNTPEDCRRAADILIGKTGAKYCVIKLGSRGAYVYGAGVEAFAPPYSVKALDPTAAGDTFTGALTLKYIQTGDILAAARYANAAGAVCVTRLGAMPALPTKEETEKLIETGVI